MSANGIEIVPPTPTAGLDRAVADLRRHRNDWLSVSIDDRVRLIEEVIRRFGALQDEWVRLGLEAKDGLGSPGAAGWEWFGGPVPVLRYLHGLRESLTDIDSRGTPQLPGRLVDGPGGRTTVRVYPSSTYERIVTRGVTAEVWMEEGQTPVDVVTTQAAAYRTPRSTGSVVLVLGAGNISGIPVLDLLTKLFVENQVVVLKMSPINAYVGPLIHRGLLPLIDRGFLRIVYGGTAEGQHLVHHPDVDEVHVTGSDRTYDAILFGTGDEGDRRKLAGDPSITKRFTGELGGIGPAIVVPGPWTVRDLAHQAEELAGHVGDNSSFSCSRTRLIITHDAWPLRTALLDELRAVFAETPPPASWYPGSGDTHARFVAAYPGAEMWGSDQDGHLPWTLIADVPSAQSDPLCFSTEAFCPIVAETAVGGDSVASYIDRAVAFANDEVWGTLAAGLIVHPDSLKDAAVADAVERAIADLRFGSVVVNTLPGIVWGMATLPWGSFPGNPPGDIQSGTGFIGNVHMFSRPQKVVVRAPFRSRPAPMWFPSRATAFAAVGRKVAEYERDRSWRRIPGIVAAALRNR